MADDKFIIKNYSETSFEKILSHAKNYEDIKVLPLIHKADGICVRNSVKNSLDYFDSGIIETSKCDVFNEELVYTFVGRPAYEETIFPVCFILEPDESLLENVFVFDTGAYFLEKYNRLVENKIDINNYRIPNNLEAIKKFISIFSGNNINYYISIGKELDKMMDFDILDNEELFSYTVLNSIHKFIDLKFDTRCRTIENVVRKPIDLKKYLKAIIVSSDQSRTKEFKDFISAINRPIDILKYSTFDINAGSESNHRIEKILYDYYIKKGLM